MTTKKKAIMIAIFIVGGIIVGLLGVLFVSGLPWGILYCGIALEENPQTPEITSAEFPFELVYEIDGETKTVSDIYVCEFDGIEMNEGIGKYREWNGYIKGTGEEYVVLYEDSEIQFVCYVGSAAYYMGDQSDPSEEFTPFILWKKYLPEMDINASGPANKDTLDEYKIKLISWKLSDPIENSFE